MEEEKKERFPLLLKGTITVTLACPCVVCI